MRTWYERWQDGEASVVYGADGPDPDWLLELHNQKAWYDEATEDELDELVDWAEEAHPDVVLIGASWHRKEDGRKMCDCCYERPTKTHSTICGGAELCEECSEALSDAYWLPQWYQRALEDPSSLTPPVRVKLRRAGYDV